MLLNFIKIRTQAFKHALLQMASHAFLVASLLIIASLLLGAAVFYQYAVLAEKKSPEIQGKVIQFDGQGYQRVLQAWQEKEKEYAAAQNATLRNPFKASD